MLAELYLSQAAVIVLVPMALVLFVFGVFYLVSKR